jgi:phosphinothricin acetyltransferase
VTEVRPATSADAEAIAAIYAPFVADSAVTFEYDAPDAQEIARRIAAAHVWLVAERGGRVIGYAYAGPYRSRAAYDWVCETAIYVDRTIKRKGVGRELYEALLDTLSDLGFIAAIAVVTSPNRESEKFHEALGFENKGVQSGIGFKAGKWHDVAFYQVDLAPRPKAPIKPAVG